MSSPARPRSLPTATKVATITDWRAAAPCAHFVQLYRSESELIEPLAAFVSDGIWLSERVVVIATREHRDAVELELRRRNVDLVSVTGTRQLVMVDAAEALGKFMVGGSPDRRLFRSTVGELVRQATSGGRKLRAFGEMVALLWSEGNAKGALELEELWNEFSRECRFSLFCAYPAAETERPVGGYSLEDIYRAHQCAIPPRERTPEARRRFD